jgi:hypothetical protein
MFEIGLPATIQPTATFSFMLFMGFWRGWFCMITHEPLNQALALGVLGLHDYSSMNAVENKFVRRETKE